MEEQTFLVKLTAINKATVKIGHSQSTVLTWCIEIEEMLNGREKQDF